jgi:hypothetical protein
VAQTTAISWTATQQADGTVTPGATWNPVPGFPGYTVSTDGQVRSPNKVLRPIVSKPDGHLYVFLSGRKKVYIHQAVLWAFVGSCPPEQECRHVNGNPADNRLENLAWGTRLENANDKRLHGTQPRGERAATAKLVEADVRAIRATYGSMSLRATARLYGVSHTAIRRAALGVKWAHLEGAVKHG